MQVTFDVGGVVTTFVPLVVFVSWAVLLAGLLLSGRGSGYLAVPLEGNQAEDIRMSQPTAISIAGLVFAALTIASTAHGPELAEPLLLSLCCFIAAYVTGFWHQDFRLALLSDGLQWTGLCLFVAGIYVFALSASGTKVALAAIAVTSFFLLALSSRAIWSHARSARANTARA
jgi:hypothetical protein